MLAVKNFQNSESGEARLSLTGIVEPIFSAAQVTKDARKMSKPLGCYEISAGACRELPIAILIDALSHSAGDEHSRRKTKEGFLGDWHAG
jgi:hypothetical protein